MNKRNSESPLPPYSRCGVSEYYGRLSERFRYGKYIAIGILVLFVVLMIGFFGDKITYENMRSFMGTVDADYYPAREDADTVYYSLSGDETAHAFGDGIVVLGNGCIRYVKYNGRLLFKDNISDLKAPRIAIGEDYFILYESGGNKYVKYVASGAEESFVSEYPVYGASVSASGDFAIISRPTVGNSLVSVYNERGALRCEYRTDRYCLSALVSDNGDDLLIVGYSADAKKKSHSVIRYSMKQNSNMFTLDLDSSLFMTAGFVGDDKIAAVFGERVLLLDERGTLISEREMEGDIVAFSSSHGNLCVAVMEDKINIISVDTERNALYNIEVTDEGDRASAVCSGDALYVCLSSGVYEISLKNGTVSRLCDRGSIRYIVSSDNIVSLVLDGSIRKLINDKIDLSE